MIKQLYPDQITMSIKNGKAKPAKEVAINIENSIELDEATFNNIQHLHNANKAIEQQHQNNSSVIVSICSAYVKGAKLEVKEGEQVFIDWDNKKLVVK